MSAPAATATSSVSQVDRPQILTTTDMGLRSGFGRPATGAGKTPVFYTAASALSRLPAVEL